jgi:hypothetical protein
VGNRFTISTISSFIVFVLLCLFVHCSVDVDGQAIIPNQDSNQSLRGLP